MSLPSENLNIPDNLGVYLDTGVDVGHDPCAQHTMIAAGRYWSFYSDGSNFSYRSSVDGTTWATAVHLSSIARGYHGCIFYDGTYVHYAKLYSSFIYYRRGTPNSDGTITWGSSEINIGYAGGADMIISMTVDSSGYPWIMSAVSDTGRIFASSKNDGTWANLSGFPQYADSSIVRGSCYKLNNRRVIIFWATSSNQIKCKVWDGISAFGSTYTFPTTTGDGASINAFTYDGNLVYVLYRNMVASINATTGVITEYGGPALDIHMPTLCWKNTAPAFYVFYKKINGSTNTFYYRRFEMIDNIWGTEYSFTLVASTDSRISGILISLGENFMLQWGGNKSYVGVFYDGGIGVTPLLRRNVSYKITIDDGSESLKTINATSFTLTAELAGNAEAHYGSRTKKNSSGSRIIKFNLTRMFYDGDENESLLISLFRNETEFDFDTYLLDKDGTDSGEINLLFTNCRLYGWKIVTNTTDEIIGEAVSGCAEDMSYINP